LGGEIGESEVMPKTNCTREIKRKRVFISLNYNKFKEKLKKDMIGVWEVMQLQLIGLRSSLKGGRETTFTFMQS